MVKKGSQMFKLGVQNLVMSWHIKLVKKKKTKVFSKKVALKRMWAYKH